MLFRPIILLFDSKKRILLQHRTDDAPTNPGNWSFFGGAMEDRETPDVAVRRECLEELNYSLENPRLIMVHKIEDYETRFVFMDEYDPSKSLELLEGQGMGWFSIGEALKLGMIKVDKEVIEYIKGKY